MGRLRTLSSGERWAYLKNADSIECRESRPGSLGRTRMISVVADIARAGTAPLRKVVIQINVRLPLSEIGLSLMLAQGSYICCSL